MLHPDITKFLVEYAQTDSTNQKKTSVRRLKNIIRKCADCYFDSYAVDDCYTQTIGIRGTASYDLMLFLCEDYWCCNQEYGSDNIRKWMQSSLGLDRMSQTIDLCF